MNLEVMRYRVAGRFLYRVPQAQQKGRPLGAAMVHKFDRLLPIRMFEHHECLVFLPLEPEDDLGVQPFIGAARAERLEHIDLIRAGCPSFIAMGLALDPSASPRVIASIDQNDVFVGGELKVVGDDTYLERLARRRIATVR
jgi:hypothetical protein